MKYTYQARSKEGKIETGTVEASSKEAAAVLLQKYNIFVTSIKEQTPSILRGGNIEFLSKVKKKDLAVFARQLAVMIRARVSITQSLKSLSVQTKDPSFKEKILKISQLVEEGVPLSDAFATFPKVFNVFFVSLIKTGEASGKISDSLMYLSDHLERDDEIMSEIKGALVYPAFVIAVLVAIIPLVIVFVMPKLIDLIQSTGVKPPAFTQLMIEFYKFLSNYGWVVMVGFLVMIFFIIFYFTTKEGRLKYQELSLKMPVVGSFLRKIFLIRFAENVSTLIGAGLSINNALRITRDTVGNPVYKRILKETEERVSEGEKISSVLIRYPDYAPPFVVQMIQVGEDTGTLDKNLMEIVRFYEKEVKRAIATFTSLLEPALIILMGIAVSLLAVSVIQPLYGSLSGI